MNEDRNISVDRMIDSVIIRTVETKTDIKLPDAPKPKVERIPSFTAPKVVANPDSALENFTDLIDMTKNRNISDTNTGISDGGNDHPKDQVMPDDDTNTPPPTIVQEMPEFPGGDVARISFFASNIKYPMIARETGVQGQVYFTFVVEKDGSISGLKLLRGIGAGCDDEAERVIAMMPKWKPGRQNGKEVRVQFNMPISFILK